MTTTTRVGAYLAGLAVLFAAALGVGSVVGQARPTTGQTQSPAPAPPTHGAMDMDGDTDD